MNNTDPFLPGFAGYSQLWHQLGRPAIERTALSHWLQDSPRKWGLDVLDARIRGLLDGGFDLQDAGGAFFKTQQTWREWDKGVSEISVLSLWQRNGILRGAAYPSAAIGSTAPFDAELLIGSVTIAGDIKTATTAASGELLDKFEPELDRWAKSRGCATPIIEFEMDGSLDLRRLGPKWVEILGQFRQGLNGTRSDAFTISLNCPLPGDAQDPADAGDLTIEVRLLPPNENPNHKWRRPVVYQDKAGVAREPDIEFARSLLEAHAVKKGKHSDASGHPPFVLAYHRRGAPGDLRPEHVSRAMQSAIGPANWLGVLFVDELALPPVLNFDLHRSETLPPALGVNTLKRAMEQA